VIKNDQRIIEQYLQCLPKGTRAGWPIGDETLTLQEIPSAVQTLRAYRKTATVRYRRPEKLYESNRRRVAVGHPLNS
jgi:hypothetical protein